MKILSDLGEAVERRWCELNYAEFAFPRVAEQALRRLDPSRAVRPESVVRWFVDAAQVPVQHQNPTFGQPPIIAFRGSRFFVEVLFWLEGATAIHQHGFSGAFQVLAGSSIHNQYRFTLRTPVNSNVAVGVLRRRSVELLRIGDVRQILAGDRMIHSTFHLDRPTVTLVVRTFTEPTPTPQFDYMHPAIAIHELELPARLDRQLKLLRLLRQCGSSAFEANAASFLRRTDYHAATLMFRHHYEALRRTSPKTLKRLLAVARSRHGKLVEAWPAVFAERARLDEIELCRAAVEDPEHRFFLALLLNISDRASILALVAERYPGLDPKELILEWVRALTDPKAATAGLFPLTLGPASLTVFGWLLDSLSWPRIVARLRKACAPGDFDHQRRNVRALIKKLEESWLRPLVV